jgi:phosphatidylserine/phosphatidylglycerophosphate/cardiolipin synthase-like enzyme
VHSRIVLTDNPAWANAVAEVSAAGCSVHVFPDTKTGLYMHEKILLTDNTALIIGSQNLTTTSLLENRELSLTLDTAIAPALSPPSAPPSTLTSPLRPRSSPQPGRRAMSTKTRLASTPATIPTHGRGVRCVDILAQQMASRRGQARSLASHLPLPDQIG